MTPVGVWVGGVLLAVSFVALAGALYGYRSEFIEMRKTYDDQGYRLTLLEGRLNQLANHVVDREKATDATGPISLDRPTPEQIAAPTRPDLAAQKPALHTGATAVGGRHRAAA